MKSVIFFIILAFSIPAFSSDADVLAKIAGTFEGNLFSGSDMDPVITSFTINESGEITGKYAMGEEEGLEVGTLNNIQVDSEFSVTMTWKDKYGKGTLRILFSEDYRIFRGFWGDSKNPVIWPWDGIRK